MAMAIFFGGPFVVGYLMAHNFKQFNQPEKVKRTWLYSTIALIVLFGGVLAIPDSVPIPNIVYNFIFTVTALYFVRKFQGEQIRQHLEDGGPVYTTWRAVGISLLFLLSLILLLLAAFYLEFI